MSTTVRGKVRYLQILYKNLCLLLICSKVGYLPSSTRCVARTPPLVASILVSASLATTGYRADSPVPVRYLLLLRPPTTWLPALPEPPSSDRRRRAPPILSLSFSFYCSSFLSLPLFSLLLLLSLGREAFIHCHSLTHPQPSPLLSEAHRGTREEPRGFEECSRLSSPLPYIGETSG